MNSTKRAEKLYFHCDPQAEKAIKSNQYYLWKQVVVIKTVITVIIAIIVIMIKIILVTMTATAI